MLFLTLLACYERVVMDARVDARHQTVRVVSQQQGVDDQIDGASCTDTAGCLAALDAHLAEERSQLTAMGASEIRNGFFLRDGELDLVNTYAVSLASELFAGGAPLRRVEAERKGKTRTFAAVLQAPPDATGRTMVRVSGPYTKLSLGDAGDLWTFTKGKPLVHLEYQNLSEGADVVIEPWIASIPGLVDALNASPLRLDPAGLLP